MYDPTNQLDTCPMCGTQKQYAALDRGWAYCGGEPGKRYICPDCWKKPEIQFCCAKAQPINCVCTRSWTCPEHGTHHVGTHD